MTATRVEAKHVDLPEGVDSSLKQGIVDVFRGNPTIHMIDSKEATGALKKLLDPKKPKTEIFNELKLPEVRNFFRHHYRLIGDYDLLHNGEETAKVMAEKIYAEVQYAKLLEKLKNFPKFKEVMQLQGVARKLKNHWQTKDVDLSDDKMAGLLDDLSKIEITTLNLNINKTLEKYLLVPDLLLGYESETTDKVIVREVRSKYDPYKSFLTANQYNPALVALLEEPVVRDALINKEIGYATDRLTTFHQSLLTIKDAKGLIGALNTVTGVDLTAILQTLPDIEGRSQRINAGQHYANMMERKENQEILNSFPALKQILEASESSLTDEKKRGNEKVLEKPLSQLITSFNAAPVATTAADFKTKIASFFNPYLTDLKDDVIEGVKDDLQRQLTNHNLITNPPFDRFPALQVLLKEPIVQKKLQDEEITLPHNFLSELISKDISDDKKLSQAINQTVRKEILNSIPSTSSLIRGEIRLDQFLAAVNPQLGSVPMLRAIFSNSTIQTALKKHWEDNTHWKPPSSDFSKKLLKIDTTQDVAQQMSELISTDRGLTSALTAEITPAVVEEIKKAQWMSQFESVNPKLAKVFAVLLEKEKTEFESFPALQAIILLEKELITQTTYDGVMNALCRHFPIKNRIAFSTELSASGVLPLASPQLAISEIKASCHYALILKKFVDTPILQGIFQKPEIQTSFPTLRVIFQNLAIQTSFIAEHKGGFTPTQFNELVDEMIGATDLDAAKKAIDKFIYATPSSPSRPLAYLDALVTDLPALQAEARWLRFKETNPALAKIVGADAKAKEAFDKKPLPDEKTTNTLLTRLADLRDDATEIDALDYIHRDLGVSVSAAGTIDVKETRAEARYERFMRAEVLNTAPAQELKNLLMHPAVKQVLIERWKDAKPNENIGILIDALAKAKTNRDIHREFGNFFGDSFEIALNKAGIPNDDAPHNLVVELLGGELHRINRLSRIDHPLLRDEWIASGIKLSKDLKDTETMADGINAFMRTNPKATNLEVDAKIKEIRNNFTDKTLPTDDELKDFFSRPALNTSSTDIYEAEQKKINDLYHTFATKGKVAADFKNVDDVTTLVNKELRQLFLGNKWTTLTSSKADIDKLLSINYATTTYDQFIENLASVVSLRPPGKFISNDELKRLVTPARFDGLKRTYILSHLEMKQFNEVLQSERVLHNQNQRVGTLKTALEKALKSPGLTDQGFNISADAKQEKDQSVTAQLSDNAKTKDQLQKFLQEREGIQVQLQLAEDVIKAYEAKGLILSPLQTMGQIGLKYLILAAAPTQAVQEEKSNQIKQMNLKKILEELKKDPDPSIAAGATALLTGVEFIPYRRNDPIKEFKDIKNENEKNAYKKMEVIYFALMNKDKIRSRIAENDREIGSLKNVISIVDQVGTTLKKAQENQSKSPPERLIATYYSHVGKHLDITADEKADEKAVIAEWNRLSGSSVDAKDIAASMSVDVSDPDHRGRVGEVKYGSLEDKQTVFYDKVLDMRGVLALTSKEVKLSFQLGKSLDKGSAYTFQTFMAKKTALSRNWPGFRVGKDAPPGTKDHEGKEVKQILDKEATYKKAQTFWKKFKDEPNEKNMEAFLKKEGDKDENGNVYGDILSNGIGLLKEYKESALTKTSKGGAFPVFGGGRELPNQNVFEAVIININALMSCHQLQTLVSSDPTKQTVYGARIKIHTNDYSLYVAMVCAATIMGYEIQDLSAFRNDPKLKLTQEPDKDNPKAHARVKSYVADLRDPKNGYYDLFKEQFKPPVQNLKNAQAALLQQAKSFTPKIGGG